MTTLAGALGMGYFEATTGELHEVRGLFAAPAGEAGDWSPLESITTRPTMVPGFVRGAELAHRRFGKLSWAELLEPAIVFAKEGFVIDHVLWGWTFEGQNFAGRYPEGRAVWFPKGTMLGVGDRLRQPELATTLDRLRDDGPDYFYTREWAKRFVAAVREHGSRGTLEDVARFRASLEEGWRPGTARGPATVRYRGCQVGPPSRAMLGLGCNLLEAGDLRARGRPTENGDSLYYQMRIMQEIWHIGSTYRPEERDLYASDDYAKKIWRVVETEPPRPFRGLFENTCALTIVDAEGNVAAGSHSSTSSWYGTGLFVDGVVLNRVLYGRGKDKLPAGLATSVWLFKDGKPSVVLATPGRAFNETLLQNIANIVEYGMTSVHRRSSIASATPIRSSGRLRSKAASRRRS